MGLRNEIEFKNWHRFDKAVDKLHSAGMEIISDVTVVMFPHRRIQGQMLGYWVFAFKKQRNIDRPKIERAKAIARECWNSIKGD